MASEPLVEASGLWAGYRPKTRRGWRSKEIRWALRDIDLRVAPGEIFGVIGANASGKSTLLQCMAGVVRPARGSMEVRGPAASLVDLSAGFHRELTGRENMLIVAVMSGMSRSEARRAYPSILEFSGLDPETMDAPMFTYSMGMWLRLGFSLLIHRNPRVLLVDEVLAVGDEAFQTRCLDRIRELVAGGCSVVLVSHDLHLVQKECERAALLNKGVLEMVGPPGEAIEAYLRSSGGSPAATKIADPRAPRARKRWKQ